MRSFLTRSVLVLTVVGFSGCYSSSAGWHMPTWDSMAFWKKGDKAPSASNVADVPSSRAMHPQPPAVTYPQDPRAGAGAYDTAATGARTAGQTDKTGAYPSTAVASRDVYGTGRTSASGYDAAGASSAKSYDKDKYGAGASKSPTNPYDRYAAPTNDNYGAASADRSSAGAYDRNSAAAVQKGAYDRNYGTTNYSGPSNNSARSATGASRGQASHEENYDSARGQSSYDYPKTSGQDDRGGSSYGTADRYPTSSNSRTYGDNGYSDTGSSYPAKSAASASRNAYEAPRESNYDSRGDYGASKAAPNETVNPFVTGGDAGYGARDTGSRDTATRTDKGYSDDPGYDQGNSRGQYASDDYQPGRSAPAVPGNTGYTPPGDTSRLPSYSSGSTGTVSKAGGYRPGGTSSYSAPSGSTGGYDAPDNTAGRYDDSYQR